MDVTTAITKRMSPYCFASTPVSPETLRSLFEASSWSASSYNEQPWRVIVATKEDPEGYAKALSHDNTDQRTSFEPRSLYSSAHPPTLSYTDPSNGPASLSRSLASQYQTTRTEQHHMRHADTARALRGSIFGPAERETGGREKAGGGAIPRRHAPLPPSGMEVGGKAERESRAVGEGESQRLFNRSIFELSGGIGAGIDMSEREGEVPVGRAVSDPTTGTLTVRPPMHTMPQVPRTYHAPFDSEAVKRRRGEPPSRIPRYRPISYPLSLMGESGAKVAPGTAHQTHSSALPGTLTMSRLDSRGRLHAEGEGEVEGEAQGGEYVEVAAQSLSLSTLASARTGSMSHVRDREPSLVGIRGMSTLATSLSPQHKVSIAVPAPAQSRATHMRHTNIQSLDPQNSLDQAEREREKEEEREVESHYPWVVARESLECCAYMRRPDHPSGLFFPAHWLCAADPSDPSLPYREAVYEGLLPPMPLPLAYPDGVQALASVYVAHDEVRPIPALPDIDRESNVKPAAVYRVTGDGMAAYSVMHVPHMSHRLHPVSGFLIGAGGDQGREKGRETLRAGPGSPEERQREVERAQEGRERRERDSADRLREQPTEMESGPEGTEEDTMGTVRVVEREGSRLGRYSLSVTQLSPHAYDPEDGEGEGDMGGERERAWDTLTGEAEAEAEGYQDGEGATSTATPSTPTVQFSIVPETETDATMQDGGPMPRDHDLTLMEQFDAVPSQYDASAVEATPHETERKREERWGEADSVAHRQRQRERQAAREPTLPSVPVPHDTHPYTHPEAGTDSHPTTETGGLTMPSGPSDPTVTDRQRERERENPRGAVSISDILHMAEASEAEGEEEGVSPYGHPLGADLTSPVAQRERHPQGEAQGEGPSVSAYSPIKQLRGTKDTTLLTLSPTSGAFPHAPPPAVSQADLVNMQMERDLAARHRREQEVETEQATIQRAAEGNIETDILQSLGMTQGGEGVSSSDPGRMSMSMSTMGSDMLDPISLMRAQWDMGAPSSPKGMGATMGRTQEVGQGMEGFSEGEREILSFSRRGSEAGQSSGQGAPSMAHAYRAFSDLSSLIPASTAAGRTEREEREEGTRQLQRQDDELVEGMNGIMRLSLVGTRERERERQRVRERRDVAGASFVTPLPKRPEARTMTGERERESEASQHWNASLAERSPKSSLDIDIELDMGLQTPATGVAVGGTGKRGDVSPQAPPKSQAVPDYIFTHVYRPEGEREAVMGIERQGDTLNKGISSHAGAARPRSDHPTYGDVSTTLPREVSQERGGRSEYALEPVGQKGSEYTLPSRYSSGTSTKGQALVFSPYSRRMSTSTSVPPTAGTHADTDRRGDASLGRERGVVEMEVPRLIQGVPVPQSYEFHDTKREREREREGDMSGSIALSLSRTARDRERGSYPSRYQSLRNVAADTLSAPLSAGDANASTSLLTDTSRHAPLASLVPAPGVHGRYYQDTHTHDPSPYKMSSHTHTHSASIDREGRSGRPAPRTSAPSYGIDASLARYTRSLEGDGGARPPIGPTSKYATPGYGSENPYPSGYHTSASSGMGHGRDRHAEGGMYGGVGLGGRRPSVGSSQHYESLYEHHTAYTDEYANTKTVSQGRDRSESTGRVSGKPSRPAPVPPSSHGHPIPYAGTHTQYGQGGGAHPYSYPPTFGQM
ncbi:hypothetical protein KIPB_006387 [Kipferlia bialata]|uniref:Nitroreductase domain-containing protein n=1 Tax=Kipferlia bialata TaxID=797122 RepID=A0A9K3GGC0_9EUKA|nr:hypothetical protein KIPB_002531 [Kipferlia bialata]GIQ84818.1 hypothetical protein KIPB_006387 [Kipferlia bialata]|eukprot:g2531.t1